MLEVWAAPTAERRAGSVAIEAAMDWKAGTVRRAEYC